ncbi:MAG: glycerol kinase GlpK [Chloroflexota bacterium]|nr:glycerol kinase GlpK [Chloroflexota bacterium]
MSDSADRYVLALDQGTSGTAALVFDRHGAPVGVADREHRQSFPQPGWVEHDPVEIFENALAVAAEALAVAGISGRQVAAIGITNQRETTLIWERATGRPIAPAVVWQDRRTAPLCQELRRAGLEPLIRERTGLLIDAYFSGTKIQWLLDNVPDARRRAEAGELAFGTVDSWLLWHLTDGAIHATDVSNAARTMLFNIYDRAWDDVLLDALRIPRTLLPDVRPSSGVFGEVAGRARDLLGGAAVPIAGVAGDQQSALFGQACFTPGMSKNTYGTGSFLLLNTGERAARSRLGLLTTVAWQIDGRVEYALEGAVFVTGAAVQWLRDGLRIIAEAAETEALAESVPDTGGVYFVPAFAGLGAPYWDMYARGAIVGLSGGSRREHLARATLEAIAYQTADVLTLMRDEGGVEVSVLRVDGGGTANRFLMQFQADLLGIPIEVASIQETTALGAAYLAGLGVDFWEDRETIARQWRPARRFEPRMGDDRRAELLAGWHRAVERARGWATA